MMISNDVDQAILVETRTGAQTDFLRVLNVELKTGRVSILLPTGEAPLRTVTPRLVLVSIVDTIVVRGSVA